MGSKTAARAKMAEAGVPIVPGGDAHTVEEAKATAARIGYPVMLKAAAGGGGKGMRLVHKEEELAGALERARSEAKKAFGDDTVYLEKAIVRPRHVEIQVLGDRHGNVVHLFERDCSIQRRHQKVVEETPCPAIDEAIVRKMGEVAVQGAKAVGYFSAGTFEFLLGEDKSFYFLEMNTRLQVEHPITELVTGFDLVREMVRVAAGEPLGFGQTGYRAARRGDRVPRLRRGSGERISAEPRRDPHASSAEPAPACATTAAPTQGCTISANYDPLISKLCVWAPDRAARRRADAPRARANTWSAGSARTSRFHERLFEHPEFVAGRYDTGFIDRYRDELLSGSRVASDDKTALAAAIAIAAHRSRDIRAARNGNGSAQRHRFRSDRRGSRRHRARLGYTRRP